jgi:hypothetical protein
MFPQAERRPLRSVPQPTRWWRCRAEQRCRDRNAENEGPSQNRGVLTKAPYPRGGFIERSSTMLSVNLWTSPTPANTPRSMTTGHTKIESAVPRLGIEVDNAIEIADKINIRTLSNTPINGHGRRQSPSRQNGFADIRFCITGSMGTRSASGGRHKRCWQPERFETRRRPAGAMRQVGKSRLVRHST